MIPPAVGKWRHLDSLKRMLDVGWENAHGVDGQHNASKPAQPRGQERDAARDLAKAGHQYDCVRHRNEIRYDRQETFWSRKMNDSGGEVEHRQHQRIETRVVPREGALSVWLISIVARRAAKLLNGRGRAGKRIPAAPA
jgi:hypothetical protein